MQCVETVPKRDILTVIMREIVCQRKLYTDYQNGIGHDTHRPIHRLIGVVHSEYTSEFLSKII